MAKNKVRKVAGKTGEPVERLPPTPSVLKKLFALSGNRCSIPGCAQPLIDPSGTLLGKVAHIHAAEAGGPRFDPSMTNEQRRSFVNLMIVCGRHHDVIDDKANEADFSAARLKKIKADHEAWFRRAERQLLEQFVDTTQATQPTYPNNLRALAAVLNDDVMADHEDDIKGVRRFIDRLKEVPLPHRQFALKLAERMRRTKKDKLLVEDVTGAFGISARKLNDMMEVLREHRLGDVDEDYPGRYVVSLYDRTPEGQPWEEMIIFCEKSGRSTDELVFDLNFALYDD